MKCPRCKSEAKEKKVEIFEESCGMGIIYSDFDVLSIAGAPSRAYKKLRLAIQDKKLYECTKPECGYEFEA